MIYVYKENLENGLGPSYERLFQNYKTMILGYSVLFVFL